MARGSVRPIGTVPRSEEASGGVGTWLGFVGLKHRGVYEERSRLLRPWSTTQLPALMDQV